MENMVDYYELINKIIKLFQHLSMSAISWRALFKMLHLPHNDFRVYNLWKDSFLNVRRD